MSMWSPFDEKIQKLSEKANELEEHKVKLTGVPSRLENIRTMFDTIIKKQITVRDETFKKDLEEKVNDLNAVLEKLSKTKTEADPVFAELETALGGLEQFTQDEPVSTSAPATTPEVVSEVTTPEATTPQVVPEVATETEAPPIMETTAPTESVMSMEESSMEETPTSVSITPDSVSTTVPQSTTETKTEAPAVVKTPSYADIVKKTTPNKPTKKAQTAKRPPWRGGYHSSKKYTRKHKKTYAKKGGKRMKRTVKKGGKRKTRKAKGGKSKK